jgi:formamidopyrimidine-DNA glycosylase
MPELPEVETIRRDLEKHLVGRRITSVEIRLPKIVRNPSDWFERELLHHSVAGISRRGKLLMLSIDGSDNTLLFHLRMTGQLVYQHGKDLVPGGHPWPPFGVELPNKYTHLILRFSDGGTLYFNDQRQFGFARLVTPAEKAAALREFGLEPLTPEFTWDNFRALFDRRKGPLKPFLLNQKLLTGLGNIYSDEVCWFAKIRPDRKMSTLREADIRRLFDGCREILAKAVEERGTTFRDYRDAAGLAGGYAKLLKVYGREGESCSRCGGTIQKIRLAGRGTHFCPDCQL